MGYESDTYGLMVGADTELEGPWMIGGFFGYSNSEAESNGTAMHEAEIDSYQFGLYGNYEMNDRLDVDFYASYGSHDNDTTRYISLIDDTANGSYDSWSASLGVKMNHDYEINEKTMLTASARADYSYIDDDGYTETGAGASNLIVGGSDVDELILGIDGKVTHDYNEKTQLTANVGLGYDALADEGSITSAFAGAPGATFKTEGVEPEELVGEVGVGATFGEDGKVQTTVRYDAELRDDFTNQTVSLKLNVPF
jgi:outer membrane autotransporter protein